MTLVKFNNQQNHKPFFNDVFETVFSEALSPDKLASKVPAVNISETENEFQIELAAPGLNKEDFKINLEKNVLSVSAEKKSEQSEENKTYNRREYSYACFVRSFNLPESADSNNINAEYINGILKINIFKKEEAKIKSREIAIK